MKSIIGQEKTLYGLIKYIFFTVFLIILFLVINMAGKIDYRCKKLFLYSNPTLLLFDIIVILIMFIIYKGFDNNLKKLSTNKKNKYYNYLIISSVLFIFLYQIFIGINIYFRSGWDANGVYEAAKLISANSSMTALDPYFSRYPNNITLSWIYSHVLRIFDGVIPLIFINCIITTISSILTFKTIEKIINKKWALISLFIYFILIGTSPWFVITYSDPFGIFLPILIFYLYIVDTKGISSMIKWIFIGLLSFFGYYIKPQVIIIFIAIILIEGWRFIYIDKSDKKKYVLGSLILIITFLVSTALHQVILKDTNVSLDKEKTFGFTHFAMMGLDEKNDGVYSQEDVDYSGSFETKEERNAANIEVIKERLHKFGLIGYLKFLSKKVLINYGDGTFAWGAEGNFYYITYPDKLGKVSNVLKSFYYHEGKNYDKTSTLQHSAWLGIIASMLGVVLIRKKNLNKNLAVLMLALLGLTCFELIFEARARYLYIYTPIYLILALFGLKEVLTRINNLFYKKKVNIDK